MLQAVLSAGAPCWVLVHSIALVLGAGIQHRLLVRGIAHGAWNCTECWGKGARGWCMVLHMVLDDDHDARAQYWVLVCDTAHAAGHRAECWCMALHMVLGTGAQYWGLVQGAGGWCIACT